MREIALTQNKFALIDDIDYDRVSKLNWTFLVKGGYAVNWYNQYYYRPMSDFIMGDPPSGFLWDHKDRNGLNNQRSNLRLATRSQNAFNSKKRKSATGLRGVYENRGGFVAQIRRDGKVVTLGWYKTAQEAAEAYDEEAIRLRGEFAVLNFARPYAIH